jgi:hypothetical protein
MAPQKTGVFIDSSIIQKIMQKVNRELEKLALYGRGKNGENLYTAATKTAQTCFF